MSELVTTLLIVIVTFLIIVGGWRYYTGHYPASTMIVTEPPVSHNGLDPKQARFMFFYVNWCPYSLKAKKAWASFKAQNKNLYNGYSVSFEDINAEADKGKTALYSVKEYPTFKLETQKKVFHMKGIPDPLTFDAFLNAALKTV